MDLAEWAERVSNNVSESGDCVETIKLQSTDGIPWETWWRNDFAGKAEEWTEHAERKVSELCEDWPPQEIQLLFIAENKAGNIISQCTKRVRGRAKGASANVFGGPSKALAESMDAQARTMDRILGTANHQLDQLSRALATSQQTNEALLQALTTERLLKEEHKPAVDPEIVNQGLQMLPALLEMVLEKATDKSPAARAAAAAAAAAASPANGPNGAH